MASSLKKDQSKIISDIGMLFMVEKGIRGEICHAVHWYAKADNNSMKIKKQDYDKNKEPLQCK